MVSLLVACAHHDLLQKRKRSIDIGSLLHCKSLGVRFLGPLIASQVDEVELGSNHLFWLLDCRSTFHMDRENCMTPRRCLVHAVVSNGSVLFTLEQTIQGLLFVLAVHHGQSLDQSLSVGSVLHCDGAPWLLVGRHWRQHVEHELVVDFHERDLHRDGIVETAADFRKDRIDAPWHDTSVFVVGSWAGHGERLSGTRLAVTHYSAVESVNHFVYWLLCAVLKDIFLRGVMKNLVEFKFPRLGLVIDHSFASILGNTHCDSLYVKQMSKALMFLRLCSGQSGCFYQQNPVLVLS